MGLLTCEYIPLFYSNLKGRINCCICSFVVFSIIDFIVVKMNYKFRVIR